MYGDAIRIIEAYMPSIGKETGVGVWDFKTKEDNSQEDGKKQMFVGPFINSGT